MSEFPPEKGPHDTNVNIRVGSTVATSARGETDVDFESCSDGDDVGVAGGHAGAFSALGVVTAASSG